MVVNFKLLIIRVSFPLSIMGLASDLVWTKLSCHAEEAQGHSYSCQLFLAQDLRWVGGVLGC